MSDNSQTRKRGRPPGKNRVPLTAEQQKKRKAYYMRELRRARKAQNSAAAHADLTDAAGCSDNVSNEKLLENVTKRIRDSKRQRTAERLRAQNNEIEAEIKRFANIGKQQHISMLVIWLLEPIGSAPPPIPEDLLYIAEEE